MDLNAIINARIIYVSWTKTSLLNGIKHFE